jgi:hypothetical protein
MVHLRRGETLRRYFEPGLENGNTFVFWGRNYNAGDIPGPERSLTWVNQPEAMYNSRNGTQHSVGQARYANAVYSYTPDFDSDDYRDGVVVETERSVTFGFRTPYIIAATPRDNSSWAIYETGCSNGLVVNARAECGISVSIDNGRTWHSREGAHPGDGIDLTDYVKGHRQYLLRFDQPARQLRDAGLTIRTVCQANAAILPRLKDSGTTVSFLASGESVVSAGPTLQHAAAQIVDGAFNTPNVTLELTAPVDNQITSIYAAAHVASGNPPSPEAKYQIEYSMGSEWRPLLQDWTVPRRGDEPPDFWSQTFCYGIVKLERSEAGKVRIRFRNSAGKKYLRVEAHLICRVPANDATRVTFAWSDSNGEHRASESFRPLEVTTWSIPTGTKVRTRWVEFAVVK